MPQRPHITGSRNPSASSNRIIDPSDVCAAASRGDLQTLEVLLKQGASPEGCDQCGAMECAIRANSLECAMLLLRSGADRNRHSAHRTWPPPVLQLIEKGWNAMLAGMIERGLDVNKRGSIMLNPRIVLERSGNLEISSTQGDWISNVRPLAFAEQLGNVDAVRLLQKAGAVAGVRIEERTQGELVDDLFQAADRGDSESIRQLVAAGVDPNSRLIRSDGEETPLVASAERGRNDAVHALLEAGADVNYTSRGFRRGMTALMAAATAGHADTVAMLLSSGAKTGGVLSVAGDGDHGTALYRAVENGHTEVARLLLEADAKIMERGFDSLALARHGKRRRIVELLESHRRGTRG